MGCCSSWGNQAQTSSGQHRPLHLTTTGHVMPGLQEWGCDDFPLEGLALAFLLCAVWQVCELDLIFNFHKVCLSESLLERRFLEGALHQGKSHA